MVIAEVFVDVCGSYLCSSDCLDNRRRTGCTVTACKYIRDSIESAVRECDDLTALNRNSGFLIVAGLDVLTDCDDQSLARDHVFLCTACSHGSTTVFDLADHLRGNAKTADMTALVKFNSGRSNECFEFNAFRDGSFDLSRQSRHIHSTATVNNADLLCAEADCGADSVHRNVSTADNGNILTG